MLMYFIFRIYCVVLQGFFVGIIFFRVSKLKNLLQINGPLSMSVIF